jgi:hypothetical protein
MSGYFLETLGLFALGHLKPIAVPPSRRRVIPLSAAVEIIRLASFKMSDSVVRAKANQPNKKERRGVALKVFDGV